MKPRTKKAAVLLTLLLVASVAAAALGWPQRILLGHAPVPPPPGQPPPPQAGAFPHGDLEALLQAHVDDQGGVDYQGLRRDQEALGRYVALLAAYSPRSHPELFPGRRDALAYDINAYNALVLWGVLERWPLSSVQDVPAGGLVTLKPGQGFFYSLRFVLGGQEINLYDLEHDVLRGYGDARIHAAINCASASCPSLQRRAFVPDTLEAQLQRAMAQMIREPRHLRVDHQRRQVRASAIFSWFREDFLTHAPSLLAYWEQAAAPGPQRRALEQARGQGYEVIFEPYDWSLNAQSAR